MNLFRVICIVISNVLSIVSIAPYVRDTVQRKTKPRIVSWLTWSLLTGIAAAATLSAHAYPAAILLIVETLACLSIVVLGWRYGERDIARFDIVCQLAAVVGLVLWLIFNSPTIAIAAGIGIDFIGGLPTLKHTWEKPYEETWMTYFVSAVGCLFTIFAITELRFDALAYPLYLTIMDTAFTLIILFRLKRSAAPAPTPPRL